MRQGQQNRRGRGRGNNNSGGSNSSNNNNNNNNNGRKQQNPLARTYESSGPDVKIRGTAAQIAEKYITLARDASAVSDVIMAENYLQHAEHYNRIIQAAQAQQQQQQQQPSMSAHHGHDGGHGNGNSAPQRISPEANGTMRDQPQPVIQPVVTLDEAPVVIAESSAETPANAPQPAPREAAREDGTRRRRRRYPANGTGDRSASGPAEANGADVVTSNRSADEALA